MGGRFGGGDGKLRLLSIARRVGRVRRVGRKWWWRRKGKIRLAVDSEENGESEAGGSAVCGQEGEKGWEGDG